ncbi:hypothetical protein PspS35_09965 [Pseudomonas sp. S35]|nr:hypothetical protein PspS35_09965 [Pseudomonas sp. S35]
MLNPFHVLRVISATVLIVAISSCASIQGGLDRFDDWLGQKSSNDGRYLASCYEPGNTFDDTTAPPCELSIRRHCPNGFTILSVGAIENSNPRSFTEKYKITAVAQCK